MGKDFFGNKLDQTINAIVAFIFETLPYLMIMFSVVYFLYKLLGPAIVIAE